ncbi:MAG: MFS transporter [Synergistaceae bacterium]|jgi:fucose permease|nr:MFS transporter [Synergistaceae bacterium]
MNIGKKSTFLCYIMNLSSAVCITMIGPTLPQISKEFSFDLSGLGILLTCQFVGFTVFVVASGIASDRIGKKSVVSAALITLTVACFAFSFAAGTLSLCLALLFLGGGMGILETMSNALLADINPDDAVFQVNFLQVFFGIGAILGPIIIGYAYSKGVSWRTVYKSCGALMIFLSLWFVANKLPELPKTEKIKLSYVKDLFFDKRFFMICLCMFFYTGAETSGWGWMSTYTERNLGFSVMEASAAVAVFWIAVTLGRLAISFSIRKFEVRRMIMSLAFLTGIICVIMGAAKERWLVWLVIFLLGLACSSQWGLILSYGTERYRRNSGTVFAMLVASGSVGMSAVPYLTGVVGDLFGMRSALLIPGMLFIMISLAFAVIPRLKTNEENFQ